MAAVCIGQAVPKEFLVVILLDMMNLEPHTGNVNCLGMGRESSMSVVNVIAHITGARDDVLGIIARLTEVSGPELTLVDPLEQGPVAVDSRRTELVGDHHVDRLVYRSVVRWTHCLDQRLSEPSQPHRVCTDIRCR